MAGKSKNSSGKGATRRARSRADLHKTSKQKPLKMLGKGRKSRRGFWNRLFGLMTANNINFMLTTGFTCLIVLLLSIAYFMYDLPDISNMTKVTKAPSIVLRTEEGDIVGSSGDIYGDYVRYNQIPRDLIKALIATEDRNFFTHHGVDPFGLIRAMAANARAGRVVQGGSTITQQLAKNIFLTSERSLKRKVQELILALSIENRYSKQEIITVYLNRVYFGAGTYGIDAAARRYFDKPAKNLLLPESALLVGLLKAPSRYAPTSNRKLAVGRATQVLMNMVDAGLITDAQQKAATGMYKSLSFPEFVNSGGQRYFTDWILDQIPDYVGTIDRDLIVTTTFYPKLQEAAEKEVNTIMDEKGTTLRASQASLLSMTPDGAVRAMVGGRSYGDSQFNRATQARRQPGSSFKLFVYLAAIEAGWRPYHMVEDAPLTVGKWSPGNYTGNYEGFVSMRRAFALSLNTVAVRLSEAAGRGKVIDMAHRLGLQSKMEAVPSIALGVTDASLLEMTTAYAHLAAGGRKVVPFGIVSIKDVYGKVLYQRKKPEPGQPLSPQTVAIANDLTMAVVEEGTGRAAAIGRPVAGKTGTSQDYHDAWFIGYTPELVTGVWVGNDNNQPMKKVTGGSLPARIWAGFSRIALKGVPVSPLPRESFGFSDQPAPIRDENGEVIGMPEQAPQQAPAQYERLPGEGQHPRPQESREGFWDNLFDGNSGGGSPSERPERRIRR